MTVIDTTRPQRTTPLATQGRIGKACRRLWVIVWLALKQFSRIDGAQWAGAFAYYAFFALFPLVVLLVTVTSAFIDRDKAGRGVIGYVESYVPISGTMQRQIFDTITGVVEARGQAGVIAVLMRRTRGIVSCVNGRAGRQQGQSRRRSTIIGKIRSGVGPRSPEMRD